MTALVVPDVIGGIIATCAVLTLAICVWAIPHHRERRRHRGGRA